MSGTWIVIVSVASGALILITFVSRVVLPAARTATVAVKKFSVVLDLLLTGRPAMIDEATGEPLPEVLPLPKALARFRGDLDSQGRDLKVLGATVSDLTTVVSELADQRSEIHQLGQVVSELKATQVEHGSAIAALIGATYHLGSDKSLEAERLRTQRETDEDGS